MNPIPKIEDIGMKNVACVFRFKTRSRFTKKSIVQRILGIVSNFTLQPICIDALTRMHYAAIAIFTLLTIVFLNRHRLLNYKLTIALKNKRVSTTSSNKTLPENFNFIPDREIDLGSLNQCKNLEITGH